MPANHASRATIESPRSRLTCTLVALVCLSFSEQSTHGASLFSVVPSGLIYELNADTGAVLNSFAPPIIPQTAGGSGLAYSGAVLFLGDINTTSIYRINPATGAVLSTLTHALGPLDALGYGTTNFGATLFALNYTTDRLSLLNPNTGATFISHLLAFDAIGGIDFNAATGALYVSDTAGTIRRINPNTAAVLGSLATGVFQTGVGLVGNRLFTSAQNSTTIIERDPLTGAILNSFSSPGGFASGLAGAPIPEPGAAAILMTALLGMVTSRRAAINAVQLAVRNRTVAPAVH